VQFQYLSFVLSFFIASFTVPLLSGCTTEPATELREVDCNNPAQVNSPECIDQLSAKCSVSGFEIGDSIAQTDGSNWLYRSETITADTLLRIDILAEWGGPTGPGTYPLDGINYRDCGLCVLAFSDCSGGSCQRVLYADEGTVEITQLDQESGGRMVGVFHNVRLKEVVISQDWTSTVVQGGQTRCLDGFAFNQELLNPNGINMSEEVVPEEPAAECQAQGTGNGVGANIPDFELTNCLGETVSLHSLGCTDETRAIWMVASADWCSPCHDYADRAKERLEQDGSNGLVLMEVIGEDATGAPATTDTCKTYAERHGLPFETTFIDPHWETLWKNVYLYPYSGGTMNLPWVAILSGPNMEYVYNSQLNSTVADSDVLDDLLDPPPSDASPED